MKPCECGAEPEIVKLFEFAKRYDCFVRCPKCGNETKAYTSRQNAKKAWEKECVERVSSEHFRVIKSRRA